MKKIVFIFAAVVFILGCARVSVGGSKEPIKVDIAMRLDVYQHVEKDLDAIDDIVSGGKKDDSQKKIEGNHSFLGSIISNAYAQEALSPEVEQAAYRRRDRIDELQGYEAKGGIGENKDGLVEARAVSAPKALIDAENSDRMTIYKLVADKNKTSLDEVQKLNAKKMQAKAPSGTPIEVMDEVSGSYEWKAK